MKTKGDNEKDAFLFFNPHPRIQFTDFRERGKGEGETYHISVASRIHPKWGVSPQPADVWDNAPIN